MKIIIAIALLVLISGCSSIKYAPNDSMGFILAGTSMYGPITLNEQMPTIKKMLSILAKDGQNKIIDAGFKKPSIYVEPNHCWATVQFQDGLSTYVMYTQFIRVPELEKEAYFIVRGIHTIDGNAGDLRTSERANRVSIALLKAIQIEP